MSTTTDLGRTFVSALGALVLTAGSVAFASAPARAATPAAQVVVTLPASTGLVGAVRY